MVQFLPRRTVNNMLTFIFYLQRNITSRVYGKMFSPFPVIHKSAESETGARENHLCTFSFPHLSSSTLFFFFFFFSIDDVSTSERESKARRGEARREPPQDTWHGIRLSSSSVLLPTFPRLWE